MLELFRLHSHDLLLISVLLANLHDLANQRFETTLTMAIETICSKHRSTTFELVHDNLFNKTLELDNLPSLPR
jgi:hypothetical protein